MFKAILLQAAMVLVAAAIAATFFGMRSAASLTIGGAAYLVPNLLFVVRLRAAAASGRASAASFFVGELVKVAATVGILVGAQMTVPDLQWIALVVGLFVALKANLLAFLLKN
ncbi:MAG TPA: ATP synthase subunit I [Rhodocyclaceae bacterium]|nr:ATP synthase subunit I [Rhodocyclaceae bacterium]